MAVGLKAPAGYEPPVRPLLGVARVRVLVLAASATNGGAQEHIRSLLGALDRDRYEPMVVTFTEGSTVARWQALGVPVEVIRGDDAMLVEAVVERIRAFEPHVIHGHMFRAEVIGTRAALRAEELGLPRPYVINHVHSSRVRSAEDRALLRALTPSMDRLVAVSRAVADKIAANGPTADVELVYNGVDLGRYDRVEACCTLPEEYGFVEGTPLVGCVARLEPEKGHATLLEAWPLVAGHVPAARLLIVGEGSLMGSLTAQAEALGLLGDACVGDACVGSRRARPGAKVVFTGRRDDVPSVTAALDVAVLPSYREAQGLVILEAMALSRPVVATRVGGIPEMIDDGVTGLLVAPHDTLRFAAAIVRLLTDHPLADTIARRGHDLVRERFSLERMAADLAALYEEGARVYESRARALVSVPA